MQTPRTAELSPAGKVDNQRTPSIQHAADHLNVLHQITLRIIRSQNLTADIRDIATAVRDLLDLETVSIAIEGMGLVVHTGPAPHFLAHTTANEQSADIDASERIAITRDGHEAGFIRATTSAHRPLDPDEIDVLTMIGELLADHFNRERANARHHAPDTTDVAALQDLLDIVEDLSSYPDVELTAKLTLGKVAGLLEAERAAFITTDVERPALFTNLPGPGLDDELTRLGGITAVQEILRGDSTVRTDDNGGRLAIPLIAHNETAGVLVIERHTGRPFSSTARALAVTIGRHLAFSLEREQRVRTASRQSMLLSLVERVTAFIASSTDADDLLESIAQEIRHTFGYDCSIGIIEGDRLVIRALGLGGPGRPPEWLHTGIPLDRGIMGRVARTGKPAFVRDVRADPDFVDTGRNIVSEIALPILAGDGVTGVLNVEASADTPLTALDYEILHILANHIGIALSNRQLIAAERDTRVAMEAIQHVSTMVAETLDPEESLRRIAVTLGETLGYPIVSLALIEDDLLVLRANYGYEPTSFPRTMRITDGISGRVARSGQAVLIEDVETDPDYVRENAGMMSEVCVPIHCNGEIVGILNVEGTLERPVTERDLRLLTTFAEHAGVLLSNARAYAALSQEATIDPMTGVPNLRFFQQTLQERSEQARRDDEPLSLAVIDLDNLKEINDTFGHLTGDQALREIAARMLRQMRGDDLLARYAGDEFVALLPGVDRAQAMTICQRLIAAAHGSPFTDEVGHRISLSVSIGVATYPLDADEATGLLRAADMAMYAAKDSGKNRAVSAREATRMRAQRQT